jgi:hypothetical protein
MREAMQAIASIEKFSVVQQELPPNQSHHSNRLSVYHERCGSVEKKLTLTKLITPEMNLDRGGVVSRGKKNFTSLEYLPHLAKCNLI